MGIGVVALFLAFAASAQPVRDDQDIDVKIGHDGSQMIVDVELRVRANPRDAWEVLTDYNDMARFVSTLRASSIDMRTGNELQVTQRGVVQFGLISFPFSTVRHITLVPYREIRTDVVDGSMKSSQFVTMLVPAGNETRILQHGIVVPDMWIPPGIGPAIIASRTRTQWQEFRTEIMRRAPPAEPAVSR
jgi:Polyketide cyclase / dehydrase and lipid transport